MKKTTLHTKTAFIASIIVLSSATFAFAQMSPDDTGRGEGYFKGRAEIGVNGQTDGEQYRGIRGNRMMGKSGMGGVVGQVSAINGTTLTVTKTSPSATTTATYTVDSSLATIMKNHATTTLSGLAIGDYVMIQGTTTNTTIVARSITDVGTTSVMMKGGHRDGSFMQRGEYRGGDESHLGFFGKIKGFFSRFF